jgi:hypothetical protein
VEAMRAARRAAVAEAEVRRQMMRRGDGRRAQRAAEEDELPLGRCI